MFYGEDLVHVHDTAFGDVARAAAAALAERVDRRGLVIELGCGSGIMTELLLGTGFEVLGVDVSEDFLRLARRRAPGARFVRGSAHEVALEPAMAVTAVGEVLSYGDHDPRPVFHRVHEALAPGGVFLFDMAGPGREARSPRRAWQEGDGWLMCLEAVEDPERRVLTRRIATFTSSGPAYRRSDELHTLRLWPPEDILEWLRAAGFDARAFDRYGPLLDLPDGVTAFEAVRPS